MENGKDAQLSEVNHNWSALGSKLIVSEKCSTPKLERFDFNGVAVVIDQRIAQRRPTIDRFQFRQFGGDKVN